MPTRNSLQDRRECPCSTGPFGSLIVAVILAFLVPGVAASASDSSESTRSGAQSDASAHATVARGFQCYDAYRYDEARSEFDRALGQARAAGDRAAEADALRGIGMVLYRRVRYAEARTELLAALQIYEALGDRAGAGWTLHHLGSVAFDRETTAAADQYWIRGLEEMETAGDRRGESQLVYDRASIMRSGPEKATALQRALRLAREIDDVRSEALALYAIGQQQFWDGRYAAAVETLERALSGFERIGAREFIAQVLMQFGRLHELHGRPERAAVFYKRAFGELERLGDKEEIALALGAMVNMHRASGQLRQAVTASHRLLALRIEIGGVRLINIERIRLARLYIGLGDHRRAGALLDEVMQGTDSFTKQLAYDPLAEVYLALGEHQKARDAADLAARLTREPGERPFMLANRARADEKLGHIADALAGVDEALQIVEDARGQLVRTDLMKRGYGERLQQLFGFAIELRARLGRPEAALEAAERARARAFLDLLATRRDRAAAATGSGEVSIAADVGNDSGLENSASAVPASVGELASIARRLDSTIVSYWVGPTATLIWVVGADGPVHSTSVRVSARRLASLIGQTTTEINRVTAGRTPSGAWRALSDLLIRPVRRFLPPARGSLLTIVPHGPLFRLSFAALVDERGTYLIERYRLHYVPSGGSLLYLKSRSAGPDNTTRYLLVANPSDPPNATAATLPALPGAMREVTAIRTALPPGTTTVLAGSRATETRVRDLLRGQTVVHLAIHGVLHDDRPLDSFLALGGRGRDPASDGRLTTAEIYGLDLDADLVVLSACRSARGRVTGDGVLGMTRAFMYAGTPSIVATLWDVADQSGPELMPGFYRSWRRGNARSAALREAQLGLLARLRAGRVTVDTPAGRRTLPDHPFFWAGFVLVGEP